MRRRYSLSILLLIIVVVTVTAVLATRRTRKANPSRPFTLRPSAIPTVAPGRTTISGTLIPRGTPPTPTIIISYDDQYAPTDPFTTAIDPTTAPIFSPFFNPTSPKPSNAETAFPTLRQPFPDNPVLSHSPSVMPQLPPLESTILPTKPETMRPSQKLSPMPSTLSSSLPTANPESNSTITIGSKTPSYGSSRKPLFGPPASQPLKKLSFQPSALSSPESPFHLVSNSTNTTRSKSPLYIRSGTPYKKPTSSPSKVTPSAPPMNMSLQPSTIHAPNSVRPSILPPVAPVRKVTISPTTRSPSNGPTQLPRTGLPTSSHSPTRRTTSIKATLSPQKVIPSAPPANKSLTPTTAHALNSVRPSLVPSVSPVHSTTFSPATRLPSKRPIYPSRTKRPTSHAPVSSKHSKSPVVGSDSTQDSSTGVASKSGNVKNGDRTHASKGASKSSTPSDYLVIRSMDDADFIKGLRYKSREKLKVADEFDASNHDHLH